ncbi:MAG: M16 family metallopeptidase [Phycisphaerae bacterium]
MVAAALLIGLVQFLDPPPMVETLDCGLRVVVIEDRTVPLVSVQLLINAGGDIDPPAQPGLMSAAHALLITAADADERLRAYALEPRNTITPDVCGFQTVLPPPLLPDVLKIEADRLDIGDGRALMAAAREAETQPASRQTTRPVSPQASQAASRPTSAPSGLAATIRATRQRFTAYTPSLDDTALARMMAGTPYARPATKIGEWLEKPGADVAIREALTRWVTPGNCVLMIVGDISAPQAIALAREKFARLKWAESPRKPWPEPPAPERIDLTTPGGEGVRMAFLTGGYASFEHAAIRVVLEHCFPHRDTAPYVSWHAERFRDAGIASLHASNATERDVLALIEEVAESGISAEELLIARGAAAAQMRGELAPFSARSHGFGFAELVGGDAIMASFELPRTQRVSASEVRMAARYLLATRYVVQSYASSSSRASDRTGANRTWSDYRVHSAWKWRDRYGDRSIVDVMKDIDLPPYSVERHPLALGGELILLTVDGASACHIRTTISGPTIRAVALDDADAVARRVDAAYAGVHEMATRAITRDQVFAIESTTQPGEADRAIELHANLFPDVVRLTQMTGGASAKLQIVVYGAFDAQDVRTFVHEVGIRGHYAPPPTNATPPRFGKVSYMPLVDDQMFSTLTLRHESITPLRAESHALALLLASGVACNGWLLSADVRACIRSGEFVLHIGGLSDPVLDRLIVLQLFALEQQNGWLCEEDTAQTRVAAWLCWNDPLNVLESAAAADTPTSSVRELHQSARFELSVFGPPNRIQLLRDFWHAREERK